MVDRILVLITFFLVAAACTSADSTSDSSDAGEPVCRADDDCGADEKCVNGGCRTRTPCDDVTCDFGVCESATGQCVNADSCNPELGDIQCLRGFYCHEGACVDEAGICDELDCVRGICDVGQRRCVAPESCFDDQECLEGQTCFQNTCAIDHCASNVCEFGRCLQSLGGMCVNIYPCSRPNDCLEGWDCHNRECVEAPCDGFCPGRQVCTSPAVGMGPTCSESVDGCFTASDCLGDRVCESYGCIEPRPCTTDAFEPNDDIASATLLPVPTSPAETRVERSLCVGDVDYFELDTSAQPADTTVTIDLSIPNGFQGVTSFTIEVVDGAGRSLGSSSGEEPDPLRIQRGTAENMFIKIQADEPKPGQYALAVAFDAPGELLNCDTQLTPGIRRLSNPRLDSAGNVVVLLEQVWRRRLLVRTQPHSGRRSHRIVGHGNASGRPVGSLRGRRYQSRLR